jgi:hypothetical protein
MTIFDNLSFMVFLLPSILGIYRWGMWFFLKFFASILYRPIPIKNNPILCPNDATIVVPIYFPHKANFLICLKSWILSGAYIVLAADITCYEDISNWIEEDDIKKCIMRDDQIKVISVSKPGKREAMWVGLQEVNTEIMAFVDDDSSWCATVLLSLLSAYENPLIGGCGTVQRVRQKGKWRTVTEVMADMRLSMRYREVKATTYMGGYASCISGRTASYRTSVLRRDGFEEFFMNDTFMGRKQSSGDDKCLTRWIFIQPDVQMWSQVCNECCVLTTFDDGLTFIKQTIRWARNTWRSDITTIFVHGKFIWKKGFWLCIILIDRFISPFTMIGGLILIIYGFIAHWDKYLLVYWVSWLLFSRGIKLFPHFLRKPWDIFYLPIFIFYNYFSACIKIYALCTLENRTWGGTRPVKMDKNNNIIRKGEFSHINNVETDEIIDIVVEDNISVANHNISVANHNISVANPNISVANPNISVVDSNVVDPNISVVDPNVVDSNVVDPNVVDSNVVDSNVVDSNISVVDSNISVVNSNISVVNSNVVDFVAYSKMKYDSNIDMKSLDEIGKLYIDTNDSYVKGNNLCMSESKCISDSDNEEVEIKNHRLHSGNIVANNINIVTL